MSDNGQEFTKQMNDFQKLWMETFSRMTQNAFAFSPDSAPPEILRQMRSGIFQALAQSWDEYLRSPQFLEGMKQWMDSAISFRKMTNEMLTKARHDAQGVAREDIDSIMLAVRHMETRVLARIEELASRVDALTPAKKNGSARRAAKPAGSAQTAPSSGPAPRTRKGPAHTPPKTTP